MVSGLWGGGCSLLGLLFLSLNYLIKAEFTALDGDQDVCVLGRWSHKLRHNIFILFACAHAEGLEALQTVLLVDLELLEGEASVLDQVGEECCKLNRFDHLLIVREVLHGDSYRAGQTTTNCRLQMSVTIRNQFQMRCRWSTIRQRPAAPLITYHRN